MKNRLTERDITRIVRRVVNEQGETPSPMNDGKKLNLELKQELIDKIKGIFQEFESDDRIDFCETLLVLHSNLSDYYDSSYVRKKGWDPKQCRNYDKLNVLLKRN